MSRRKIAGYVILSLLIISGAVLYQWLRPTPALNNFEMYEASESELFEGKRLSETYCSSCHIFPEPSLLNKDMWVEHTLPAMAPKLGITHHNNITYSKDTRPHVPENYYPDSAMLSSDEWQKILSYYYNAAPNELIPEKREPPIITDEIFFKAHEPVYRTDAPSTATAVRFDPGNKLIYASDIEGTNFLIFNEQLELENSLFLNSTLSDIQFKEDPHYRGERGLILTYLGSLIPSDAPEGFIVQTRYNPDPQNRAGGSLNYVIEELVRPVETLYKDLNQDGIPDLLVSEFGHRTGSLFWLKGNSDGTFETDKNVLVNEPGCIQSHVVDYSGNGLKDIVSLCTQAMQKILLFENLGDGEFQRKTLLQLPLTAGSSSFELHDFNDSGHLDILYTSGDNADFSITYKPYHGVYIYLNNGSSNYSQKWFYPINGAYNAKARDFNGNGLPDIAVISFFGDYLNRPEEGFIFFLNNGEPDALSFTPYHHPETARGRWITMDVADWTGNGFDDILLANYSMGPDVEPEQAQMDDVFSKGPLFLLLENMSE